MFLKLKNKLQKYLYLFWIYIIIHVKDKVNKRILLDKSNMYVVYYNNIVEDLYICPDGQSALELFNLCTQLNEKLHRNYTQVLYGKVDIVFKYKIAKLMNVCFTWDASEQERREVCKYIADTPARIN